MIFDGREFAKKRVAQLREQFSFLTEPLVLVAFSVGENAASASFLKIKKRVAEEIGITLRLEEFPATSSQEEIVSRIRQVGSDASVAGIIVQLPLPAGYDTQAILDAISPEKDPDMLSESARTLFQNGASKITPPVVAATQKIITASGVSLQNKNIVVVGEGELVGKPVAVWLRLSGHAPTVVNKDTPNQKEIFRQADVLISGAGVPGLITPDNLKPGVVLIDAGTSEQGGKMTGDCAPECASVAGFFTPVPGGVGPVVVVELFGNLITLARDSH